MFYSKKELIDMDLSEHIWQLSESSYEHGSPWSKEQFQQDIEQSMSHYLICMKEKRWLGFISYHLILDEVEITHVVIHNEYRRQGYGKAMVDQLMKELKEKRVAQVFLEVRASNHNARSLYQSKGFVGINTRKNYYRCPTEDGVVMCLKIKEVSQ